ncbi:matrixin family metalloprotease [Paenibacillus dakarensis]|uniref:matrixin family metalloprotease n=1 Tax=Paenibacillus dakarensis TaxID=1527293 RepID=UPI0006D57BE4|nr:matrixin family metalloprotease [Paenibacillus dakarensis]
MKSKTKLMHILVFMIVLSFTFSSYALAYNNENNMCGTWKSPGNIEYKFIGDTPSDYKNIFARAVVGWNDTPTKIGLSHDYTLTTANVFGIYNEEGSNMGRAFLYCKPFTSEASSGNAGLNNLWFYNYSGSKNKTNLQINTALHEIGHFIGLGHSTVPPTVMSAYGLYTDTIPLKDDINGINAMYP